MKTFLKRALWGTLIAGGVTLLGATAANAADTTGEDGLLSGNQALISLDAPVSIVGNAVSLIGDSTAVSTPAPAT
ncbi:MAG: chaplin family protein, partial [Microbacterium sp.]